MSVRRTRLVASVVGRSVDAVTRTVEHGTDGADVVEVRIDGLANAGEADLRQLRDASDRPVILTCRSRAEGGSFEGSESERLSLLERGARAGFDYIDVEIAALEKAFPKGNAHLILSHHDFDGLPRDPGALVEKALEMGADVVKLAARVSSLDEAWTLASMGDAVQIGRASCRERV